MAGVRQFDDELTELQWRIDHPRPGAEGQPCAVSIDGGPLLYGEFILEQEHEVTYFAEERQHIGGFRSWMLVVEDGIEWSPDPLEIRFGDTRELPYEGRAYPAAIVVEFDRSVTTLRGEGELIRHITGEHAVKQS